VNRRHTAASCEKDAQELARALEAIVAKADAAEQATLLRVLRRWPQMRTLTKHALFASIVAEFRGVIDAANVPR
jgi:2-oxo-4-hydroxy-4-carboxy--5-ureidoimidazoline (OHCU) decarboxylase